MAKAYRAWIKGELKYKFEVDDEPDPHIWAMAMQNRGYKIEEGTLQWDEQDRCGWKWQPITLKAKQCKPYRPKDIDYQTACKFFDAKKKHFIDWRVTGKTFMDKVAEEMGLTLKQTIRMSKTLGTPAYAKYRDLYAAGVRDYIEPFTPIISEEIFNKVHDLYEQGFIIKNIAEMLNLNCTTTSNIVQNRCKKYQIFWEARCKISPTK